VEDRPDLNGAEGGGSTFEQFLEFVPDAIVGVGREGRIVLVNRHAEELFGYEREELENHSLDLLVPRRFRKTHPKQWGGFFKDPHHREIGADLELFAVRKDGSEFPAEIGLSSIEWNGETIAIAAVRDVSEHGESERERTQRRAIGELQASHRETVERLAGAIEMYDPQSDRHVNQMAAIAALLGTRLGLDSQRMLLLRGGAGA
jgi:PAS domain S-box-containing protein